MSVVTESRTFPASSSRRPPFSHRRFALTLAAGCLIAIAALPADAGPVEMGAGLIPSGYVTACGKGYDTAIVFDFAGRMPAGNSAYQVISGRASATRSCTAPRPRPPEALVALGDPTTTFSIAGGGWRATMRGETPSGTFNWICSGRVTVLYAGDEVDNDENSPGPLYDAGVRTGPWWLFKLTCRAKSTSRFFSLASVLISPTNENMSCCDRRYDVVGAYAAHRLP